MVGDKAGVEIARHKLRMGQQRRLKRNIAADAADHKSIERLAHFGNRLGTVLAVHDELGNHRVVVHRNFAAVLHAGVDPHALPPVGVRGKHGFRWRLETHQTADRRQEAAKRVFGIDAALDGPAVALHVFLRQGQLFAGGDPDHQLDQVQPGDAFRHRVLDLQAGVHFQKVKALVFADDELHRAGALVVHRLGERHRLLAHGFTRGLADERRRRFFNDFLVPALNRALALVQVNHVAVAVAHELNFDVARFLDKLFNKHPVVAKAVARFVAARGEAFKSFLVIEGDTQALAAAAGTGLDHHWVANRLGNFDRLVRALDGLIDAGNAVHPRRTRQLFGGDLVAHRSNRIMLGTNENNAFFFHPL